MKGSLAGFILALASSFLSLGTSGLALYGVAFPVIERFYPPMAQWHGPWVWPVLVGVTILWAPSFLVAGATSQYLNSRNWTPGRRRLAYAAVLWAGAVIAWLVVLQLNFPPGGRG
jgi:hypothetical protein